MSYNDILNIKRERETKMSILDRIESYKIPIHSYVAAITHIKEVGDLTGEEHRIRIAHFASGGHDLDDRTAKYTYLYCVQEAVRSPDTYATSKQLYDVAVDKARTFIDNNPWVFAEKEDETPKKRRSGPSKKEKTCVLWSAHKDDGWTRKQWIAKLVDEVDLTPAGASTYYAKLKKETFGC